MVVIDRPLHKYMPIALMMTRAREKQIDVHTCIHMDFIWRVSERLSSVLNQASEAVPSSSASSSAMSPPSTPMPRERRLARLEHCLRYPSPYRNELVQCLQQIAPDVEMMRSVGYSVTDLMDLQLGLTELTAIGFSQEDLYEIGLTEEMSRSPSIYASLLVGLQNAGGGNDNGNDDDNCNEEEGEEEEAGYYL